MILLLKRFIIILAFGILTLLMQGTVLGSFLPTFLIPDFLLTILVYLSFYQATSFGAVLGFLLGLELDLWSGMALGPWAGSYVATFGAIVLLSQRIFVESALAVMCAVFCAVLISSAIYLVLSGGMSTVGIAEITSALLKGVVTGIFAPAVFWVLRRVVKI